jgi:hypothetical protein
LRQKPKTKIATFRYKINTKLITIKIVNDMALKKDAKILNFKISL